MSTRDNILDEALQIANTKGVESLSVRAVARRLELSPGNVSYHFPRKVDLLLGLSERLGAGNNARWQSVQPTRVDEYLELLRGVFRWQYQFRGMILSLPHMLEAHPEIRVLYRQTERRRNAQNYARVLALRDAGELRATEQQVERFVMHVRLTARFWLGEFRTTYYRHAIDDVIGHYLALIADLFLPFATDDARERLTPYLDGLMGLRVDEDALETAV